MLNLNLMSINLPQVPKPVIPEAVLVGNPASDRLNDGPPIKAFEGDNLHGEKIVQMKELRIRDYELGGDFLVFGYKTGITSYLKPLTSNLYLLCFQPKTQNRSKNIPLDNNPQQGGEHAADNQSRRSRAAGGGDLQCQEQDDRFCHDYRQILVHGDLG
jgi:hypothetical protein